MIAIPAIALAFVAAVVMSETALAGRRLQTGLSRVIAVHAGTAAIAVASLTVAYQVKPVAVVIFWAGAFLIWLGVRSHVESSVALRMVYLLRIRPMTAAELVRTYDMYYGAASRSEELLRARLIERRGETVSLTPRGKFVLGVAAWLR